MFGFLAPLLGALGGGSGVASIISGLSQAKASRRAASAQGVDYQRLVADSKAAGFNPLTALMAGGGAGYQREFSPALSSGSFIADAVGRAIDTGYNRKQDRDALTMAINERDYQRQQSLARSAAVPTRRFGYALTDVQPFGGARGPSSVSRPALGSAAGPLPIFVPVVGSDGVVRSGPNPNGVDLDQAAYAIGSDFYYRATADAKKYSENVTARAEAFRAERARRRGDQGVLWEHPKLPPVKYRRLIPSTGREYQHTIDDPARSEMFNMNSFGAW